MNITQKIANLNYFGGKGMKENVKRAISDIVKDVGTMPPSKRVLKVIGDIEYYALAYDVEIDPYTQRMIDLAAYKASLALE